MTAPHIRFHTGTHRVHKVIIGHSFSLKFDADSAYEYDVWTDWNNREWHSRDLIQTESHVYTLRLLSEQTGFFTLKIRYRKKGDKKFSVSKQQLEIHVDPSWIENAIVYNVFIRAYGAKAKDNISPAEGGTFEEVIKHMDNLVKLGIDVIYLNPFHQIGELYRKYNPNDHLPYYLQPGSPYSIKDPKSIDPEIAFHQQDPNKFLTDPKNQFRKMVDAAHKRGLRVFMDLVFNHTSHDFVLQKYYPEWFLYKEHIDSPDDPYIYPEETHEGKPWGDPKHTVSPYNYGQFVWTDTAQLHWQYNSPPAPNDPPPNTKIKEMYEYFKSVPKYWINEFGIDGFRCDIAYNIPPDFWHECIKEARQTAKDSYPSNGAVDGELIFIAESHQDKLRELFESGFSYVYGNYSNKLFKPLHLKGYLDYMYNIGSDEFPPFSQWFIFPECHDFDRITSKLVPGHSTDDFETDYSEKKEASIRSNASRWVLTATLPGMPMVFTGFEKVEWKQVDHISYSSIDWKNNKDIIDVIVRVNRIRHQHEALQTGTYTFIDTSQGLDEDTKLFAYMRYSPVETILVVVNMDIYNPTSGVLYLPSFDNFDPDKKYVLKDLLDNKIYFREGFHLFVDLKPGQSHIFLIEQSWGD